ncbi:MAG: cell division protein ZapA [Flavobacteriaceae bacterium]|nr:cell division protein ZapA [Flavobacteriaceae bacterium]
MSKKPYKVNIKIAGRSYPLNVANELDEQSTRMAAKEINKLIAELEDTYAVGDKQDVLSMCALQFASQICSEKLSKDKVKIEVIDKLKSISSKIEYL